MIYRKKTSKPCRFCKAKDKDFDYKKTEKWKYYTTDRGKIIPRRITGTCAKHQRKLTVAIRRARFMALFPFTSDTFR